MAIIGGAVPGCHRRPTTHGSGPKPGCADVRSAPSVPCGEGATSWRPRFGTTTAGSTPASCRLIEPTCGRAPSNFSTQRVAAGRVRLPGTPVAGLSRSSSPAARVPRFASLPRAAGARERSLQSPIRTGPFAITRASSAREVHVLEHDVSQYVGPVPRAVMHLPARPAADFEPSRSDPQVRSRHHNTWAGQGQGWTFFLPQRRGLRRSTGPSSRRAPGATSPDALAGVREAKRFRGDDHGYHRPGLDGSRALFNTYGELMRAMTGGLFHFSSGAQGRADLRCRDGRRPRCSLRGRRVARVPALPTATSPGQSTSQPRQTRSAAGREGPEDRSASSRLRAARRRPSQRLPASRCPRSAPVGAGYPLRTAGAHVRVLPRRLGGITGGFRSVPDIAAPAGTIVSLELRRLPRQGRWRRCC